MAKLCAFFFQSVKFALFSCQVHELKFLQNFPYLSWVSAFTSVGGRVSLHLLRNYHHQSRLCYRTALHLLIRKGECAQATFNYPCGTRYMCCLLGVFFVSSFKLGLQFFCFLGYCGYFQIGVLSPAFQLSGWLFIFCRTMTSEFLLLCDELPHCFMFDVCIIIVQYSQFFQSFFEIFCLVAFVINLIIFFNMLS